MHTCPRETSLELFRRMCLVRYFELNVKRVYDAGLMPKIPIYLSVGQESIAASLSMVFNDVAIFGQHRCHDIYLAFGGPPEKLIDELLGLPTGCAGGMGGSASIHCPKIKMFGHDGFMGSQVPIGLGYALGKPSITIVVMGDASAEEGFVLESLGWAQTKKAQILFIVSDNNLSILTKKEVRRSWDIATHAGFGMKTANDFDHPWTLMKWARYLKERPEHLPILFNILTVRELWHAGTGRDSPPNKFNRFNITKTEMRQFGLGQEADTIEKKMQKYTEDIWDQRLKFAGRV